MFGYVKKTKAANLLLKAMQQISLNSYRLPNNVVTYGFNDTCGQIDAYASNDDLYSIVNKIDGLCKTIPLLAYEVKDEKQFNKYKLIQNKIKQSKNYTNKSIADLAELQSKSLEIIGDNDALQKLLDKPNEYESKDEFYSGVYTFPLLTGNDYIVMTLLEEGANKGRPYSLFHLSPAFTQIVASSDLQRHIIRYQYSLYGNKLTFEPEEIIHRKYFNPLYDYLGTELYGLSPLQAAARRLTQSNNESDYANRSLINAGAEGFMSNEDADFNPETFGAVKDDILRELGAARDRGGSNINAKKLALLLGKWKYNQIGISPVDMQLIEQGKITFKKLCNIYGISDRLFNNDATGSEISIDKMLRDAFISVAIPEVSSVRDSFNHKITPLFTDKKRFIDYDISDVTQLQEDMNSVIQRFSNAPAFRVNDLYEAMGWGRLEDPNADVVLVKNGYSMLEDITTPVNLDTSSLDNSGLNDYGG